MNYQYNIEFQVETEKPTIKSEKPASPEFSQTEMIDCQPDLVAYPSNVKWYISDDDEVNFNITSHKPCLQMDFQPLNLLDSTHFFENVNNNNNNKRRKRMPHTNINFMF